MLNDPAEPAIHGANAPLPKTLSYWGVLTNHKAITQDVLTYKYDGSGTEDDPYAVSWLPDDPRNPMNISMAQKITILLVAGLATLIVSLSSSAYVGSVSQIEAYFDVGDEVAVLGLSLFVLGFSLGPLFWVRAYLASKACYLT